MASVLLLRGMGMTSLRRLSVTRTALIARTTISTGAEGEGYISRNRKLKRPLTPSLSLLTQHPDMVWVLSFGHRLSGIVLTAGISTIAVTYLAMGQPFPELVKNFDFVSNYPTLWTAGKFILALPICYHMVNGVRHLAWDAGKGFELRVLYRTGYIMMVTVALLTGYMALYKPSP